MSEGIRQIELQSFSNDYQDQVLGYNTELKDHFQGLSVNPERGPPCNLSCSGPQSPARPAACSQPWPGLAAPRPARLRPARPHSLDPGAHGPRASSWARGPRSALRCAARPPVADRPPSGALPAPSSLPSGWGPPARGSLPRRRRRRLQGLMNSLQPGERHGRRRAYSARAAPSASHRRPSRPRCRRRCPAEAAGKCSPLPWAGPRNRGGRGRGRGRGGSEVTHGSLRGRAPEDSGVPTCAGPYTALPQCASLETSTHLLSRPEETLILPWRPSKKLSPILSLEASHLALLTES
ncbi:uncharacterized protein LOC144578718 [Callithrix jacchus]